MPPKARDATTPQHQGQLFIILYTSDSYVHINSPSSYHWTFVLREHPNNVWTQYHLEEVLPTVELDTHRSRRSGGGSLLCQSPFFYPPEPSCMIGDIVLGTVMNVQRLVDVFLTNPYLARHLYEWKDEHCKAWVQSLAKMVVDDACVLLDKSFPDLDFVWAELQYRTDRKSKWPDKVNKDETRQSGKAEA